MAFPASIKTDTWLSGYDLDPRPDLRDDHRLWQAALAEAWMMGERGAKSREAEANATGAGRQIDGEVDQAAASQNNVPRSLYHLLHGLRCGGAELQKQRNRSGKKFLRLIYKPLLGPGGWDEDKLLQDWLQPAKDEMKECFEKALATYEMWEEMQAERAADKMAEGKTSKSSRDSEGKTEEQVRSDLQTSSGPSQASLFRPA